MSLGMSFNGTHSSTFGDVKCTPDIPLLPEKRKYTMEIPGRDGEFDFNINSYAPRIISVDCLVKGISRTNLRSVLSKIAVWLSGSGHLVFDYDTTKRWMAKVYSGIDISKAPSSAQFSISFEVQPFAEDVNAISGSVGTAQDYGSPVKFHPVITVTMTGSASSLQLSLLSTGEFVKVTDTLVSGNILLFDMSTGLITKNGASCMAKVSIDSMPFGIPPGTQTVSITTTGTYTVTMSYRKRYLYA